MSPHVDTECSPASHGASHAQNRHAVHSEECTATVFRGGAPSYFSQLRCSHPLDSAALARFASARSGIEGPKPRFVTRGSHAGARAQSEAQRQNPLGFCGSDVARLAVCRRRRIAQSRARTGVSPEKERSRSRLRSSRSGYRYRLVALPSAAPCSHAPRSSRGTSSHAPGAQLKIRRARSTRVRERGALLISGKRSQRFSCACGSRSVGARDTCSGGWSVSSVKYPALNSVQPKIQRLRNSLVKLVPYAHDAATRWCATHIKCVLVAHARATRRATSAEGSFAAEDRRCFTQKVGRSSRRRSQRQ